MTIIEAVTQVYGIEEEFIFKKSRCKKSSEPRMICVALYRATGLMSGKKLSAYFGLTSASLFNAAKKTSNYIKYDSGFREKVNLILASMYDSKERREHVVNQMLNYRRD
jgi:chromosomal replication initiation ATPase DnaA